MKGVRGERCERCVGEREVLTDKHSKCIRSQLLYQDGISRLVSFKYL